MRSALRNVLIYGAVAALALSCLKLLAISPLLVDWGRELAAAGIALVGVVVGIILRERGESRRKSGTLSSHDARDVSPTGQTTAVLLSPREREVLRLLAEGLSNKQMARAQRVGEHGQDASGQQALLFNPLLQGALMFATVFLIGLIETLIGAWIVSRSSSTLTAGRHAS